MVSLFPFGEIGKNMWSIGVGKLPDSNTKRVLQKLLGKNRDFKQKFENATKKAIQEATKELQLNDSNVGPLADLIARVDWFPSLWEAVVSGDSLQKETFLTFLKEAPIGQDFEKNYKVSLAEWSEELCACFNCEIVTEPYWASLFEIRQLREENLQLHATTHAKLDQLLDANKTSNEAFSQQSEKDQDKEDFEAKHRKDLVDALILELGKLKARDVKTALVERCKLPINIEKDDCDLSLAHNLVHMKVPRAVRTLRLAFASMSRTGLTKAEAEEAWACGSRMIGVVLLGSIHAGWLYENRQKLNPYSNEFLEVIQTFSLLGTEIAFSALKRIWPRFSETSDYQNLKGQFSHKLSFEAGIVARPFVTTMKQILFSNLNPSKKTPDFKHPSDDDFLNETIENRIDENHQPYIVIDINMASGQGPLIDEIQRILKREIPDLVILAVALGSQETVVVGEKRLQISVAEFFDAKLKHMQQFPN